MADKQNLFSRVRLVYRRSSLLLKCSVLTTIVLCTVCLGIFGHTIRENRQLAEAKRQEAAALESENKQLTDKKDALGTVQSVEQIASEELGLVKPGTEIITPQK